MSKKTTNSSKKNGGCLTICLGIMLLSIYWIYGIIWLIFLRKRLADNPELQKKTTTKHAIFTALSFLLFVFSIGNSSNEPVKPATNVVEQEVSIEGAIHELSPEQTIEEDISTIDTIDDMTIHFLDVGQGLSILVECSDEYLIYDGGGRDTSSYVVAYLKEQGVTNLKYLISSHYDEDHLAGLIGCLNVFNVENVIGADYIPDTDLYTSFVSKIDSLALNIQHPIPGTIYNLGSSTIAILSPNSFSDSESNNNSIAIKITNGKNSFLFTGDAEYSSEYNMIDSNIDLKCDVLCVGHHGSADSTSQKFLTTVQPTYAVISCGENNIYSHPDAETLNRLESTVTELFRTDKQGTIIANSDGTQISWNVSPCNDFSSGTSMPEDVYVSLIDTTPESSTESVDSKSYISEESSVVDAPAQNSDSQATTNTSNEGSNFDMYNTPEQQNTTMSWVLNTNSKKIHYPSCKSVAKIAPHNYSTSNETLDTLRSQGYDTCGNCFK